MEKLIKIAGQQFYYSTIKDIVNQKIKVGKCAIILDEEDLEVLINSSSILGNEVSQLIIIGKSLSRSYHQLKGKNILLLSANDLDEAIRFAILSVELNKNIVCTSKGSKDKVKEIMEELAA